MDKAYYEMTREEKKVEELRLLDLKIAQAMELLAFLQLQKRGKSTIGKQERKIEKLQAKYDKISSGKRYCPYCKQLVALEDFYSKSRLYEVSALDTSGYCKSCSKVYHKEYRQRNGSLKTEP